MRNRFLLQLLLLTAALAVNANSAAGATDGLPRTLPRPLAAHPGNVFLAGEEVVIPISLRSAPEWLLLDSTNRWVAEVKAAGATVALGRLEPGFYRLRPTVGGAGTNWVSLAVLPALKAPTPLTSPIGLDVAMAWFYPPEKMDGVANLCALAGVNWVRDRLRWDEIEPERGKFAGPGKYDASARAQQRAGLQVLQVIHLSPPWANPQTKRFPLDLRDAYRFYREMARRWPGQVLAFEPWNEPDIEVFGGHTGAEIASLQKAGYLGLKAGNPKIRAGLAVFALHNPGQLADLQANEAWPYFDTFNLHHYEPFENYPNLYADFRAVSAGRPLWTTEAARPVKWADDATKEPTDADLRVQAERVAKTFACALHEGTLLFYFLLPHYVEGPTQFGILRRDLTPRPAYVALAAVGRLLADAKPLGRLATGGSQQAYLFRAAPEGEPRDVLVAWDDQDRSAIRLPVLPEAVFDHLGRRGEPRTDVELSSAPIFVQLAKGTARPWNVTPPPQAPDRLKGAPCPIVLQAVWPEAKTELKQSAYQISATEPTVIPVFAYNLGEKPARGRFRVDAPAGWSVRFPDTADVAPDERKELALTITPPSEPPATPVPLQLRGDFGRSGRTTLSLQMLPEGKRPAEAQ
jgi:hypothetical protein